MGTTPGVRQGTTHGTRGRKTQHVGHLERIGVTHDGPPRIESIHSDPTRANLHRIKGNPLLLSPAARAIHPLVGAIAIVNKLTNGGQ